MLSPLILLKTSVLGTMICVVVRKQREVGFLPKFALLVNCGVKV